MEIYKHLSDIPHSSINIPVELKLDDLEQLVNQQVGDLLDQHGVDIMADDDDLDIRVEKSADIKMGVQGNAISITVPLHLFIKKDITFTKVKAEGDINLYFLSQFKISEDWELETQTAIEKYEWTRKPVIKLGVVNIPIKSIANKIVERSKETVAREIDKQLEQNFALKDMLLPAWRKIQDPIKVSDEYNAWLKVVPNKVGMTPLYSSQRIIKSTMVIHTEAKVIIGGFAPDTIVRPLLPFSEIAQAKDDFQLHLKTGIPYDSIEVLAKQQFIGETFTDKNRSVTVVDLEVFGQNDQIVVNTVLTGSYEGSLYLTGTPHYDQKKELLELKDLDFELKTKNFLHKSMAWVFQKGLKKRLEENLRLPVGDKKAEWIELIEQQLTNLDLPSNLKMEANIEELTISRFFIQQEALVLLVSSEGKMQLNIEHLQIPDIK